MLTEYIVTLRGKPCDVVGIKSLHPEGILVPNATTVRTFKIVRGVRRANNRARAQAEKAIRAAVRVSRALKHPNMLDDVASFAAVRAAEGTEPQLYKIIGVSIPSGGSLSDAPESKTLLL